MSQEEFTHTPGPWRWEVSMRGKHVRLSGGRPEYDLSVLSFCRWGMQGATICLLDNNPPLTTRSALHARPERIVPIHGREHHAHWLSTIDHPDARLIAAAPEILSALVKLRDWYQDATRLPAVEANAVIAAATRVPRDG